MNWWWLRTRLLVRWGRIYFWRWFTAHYVTHEAIAHLGVYWEGHDYFLCRGPHAWVWARARLHLYRYPYRRVYIKPREQS